MESVRAADSVCSLLMCAPGLRRRGLFLRKSVRPDLRWGGLGGGSERWHITVWLEVRVLPSPPRSLSNLQIAGDGHRSPQLAGFCGCVSVWTETVSDLNLVLDGLSLGRGIPFPRCRSIFETWNLIAGPCP